MNIYDSRCLKTTKSEAVSHLHGHCLSISSAYFSPRTGNRVLATCMDNHIRWSRLSTLNNCVIIIVVYFSMPAQCPSWTLLTGYMTRLKWLRSLPCWHPSSKSTFLFFFHQLCAFLFFRLFSVLVWDSCNLNVLTTCVINLYLQARHVHRPLADQTLSSVGPQTGRLLCGGEHVEASEGWGVPRRRPAPAHLHGWREPQHSAVRHCFPSHKECLTGRQCVRAPACLFRLRWRPKCVTKSSGCLQLGRKNK